ncbi:MAG: S8 family serine peptidase [Acidobacteriota bacterium]|nr:S8 family serine peptidase [Acidobacteriota bacterium]
MIEREPYTSGKSAARIGLRLCVPLLLLADPGSAGSQDGLPNLRPVRPEGWSDSLVISNRQETHTETLRLMAQDRLFVDFAVINSGGSPAAARFRIELFLDGRLRETFDVAPPLDPQVFRFREDYPLGRLSSGTHTLRVVVDGGEAVPESDETDNQYTKTFFVSGACFPLTTRVSPRGAGTVTPNREPNCGSTTLSVRSSDVDDQDSNQKLGMGGEPVLQAQRDRAFEALRARVRGEGKAKVIVGLKTDGQSVSAAVSSLNEVQARSPLISRVQQSLLTRLGGHNLSSVRRFKYMPHVAMEVDEPALEALASDPEVVTLEEDIRVEPLLETSTTLVGAPNAWNLGYSGAGQAVAILDTGVDGKHPFLRGRVVAEACYSGAESRWTPLCPGGVRESTGMESGEPCSSSSSCFHGTAVAGVAAGRGTMFSGVAPESGIIAIQAFSQCPGPVNCLASSTSDWVAGLERVLELSGGYDIAAVNMSFGGDLFSEECDAEFPAVKAAMDNLRALGIAPVAASGNKGSSTGIDFPSCISSAVSVGSTDTGADETTADEVSVFSNNSPLLDLLAPGRGINTSVPGEDFGRFNGTSFSTPHVAGAWAVLKSKAPNASVAELLSALKSTGVPVVDPRNQLIKPRIQVDAALDKIVREIPYTTGTRLTLTAGPNPGFRFKGWQGCDSPSGNRCAVEIDSSRQVVALFEPTSAAHPDLIPTSLVAPPTADFGRPVSIYAAVSNPGPVDAGPFRVGFYLSVDDIITIDDTWFAACSFDSGLAAGESETCDRLFPLPPRLSAGRYFLGAIVDDLDQVSESSETNNVKASDGGPLEVFAPPPGARSFIPVVLSSAGLRNSFFTSELTLTNRSAQETRLEFIYKSHRGGGSGLASDVIAPGRQMIVPNALDYLRQQGLPVPSTGNRIGTLEVRLPDSSSEIGALVRTATAVPEGRAGLAYAGIDGDRGFHEAVYLCGLRQNTRDRSNVAFQNMGTTADGTITLKTTVFSGDPGDDTVRDLGTMELGPGEFHQFSPVLGTVANGYVRVEPVDGEAPFYAYGVINDQTNSDGSFVFPVSAGSLEGSLRHTLPVIVEVNEFSSELIVTNFSEETKTLDFSFVAEGLTTPDDTAGFSLRLEPGRQRIIPDVIHTELRRKGVQGVPAGRGGLAGALFATVKSGDMSGIVIGARTSSSDGRGGQYGVFYNAVPDGAAVTGSAWIDALQQNEENRSNLALVNTGEVDDSPSLFEIDIYDGETGMLVRTVSMDNVRPEDANGIRLAARRWHQINGILSKYTRGTTQGYVRVRRISGNNPFLAYGVVNDGGAPGQRSGDGAYVPARD